MRLGRLHTHACSSMDDPCTHTAYYIWLPEENLCRVSEATMQVIRVTYCRVFDYRIGRIMWSLKATQLHLNKHARTHTHMHACTHTPYKTWSVMHTQVIQTSTDRKQHSKDALLTHGCTHLQALAYLGCNRSRFPFPPQLLAPHTAGTHSMEL